MKRLLLIDTETTGTNHAADCPLEVAWGVYSIPDAALLSVRSCLVDAATYRPDGVVPDGVEAERKHHITRAMWTRGEPWSDVETLVRHEAIGCDAIVAHNVAFDRGWFRDETVLGMTWLDTCGPDVEWPGWPSGHSLAAIADALEVCRAGAHRAAADVMILARVMTKASKPNVWVDLRAMLAPALRQRSLYAVADTSFSAERNALAKAAGFRWVPDAREWRATIADEDAEKLPFGVRKVEKEKEAAE